MGAPLDQIVKISITALTQAVPQAGFGIPLIMGPTNPFGGDLVRYYTDPADMLDDGFTTSDPEYKAAVKACSQDLSPTQFGVGYYTAAVAQIDTITPTAVNDHVYAPTIDGVAYSFTADSSATATEVVTGLKALINADSACPATATGTTTLILTAKVAGVGFTTSIVADANMALVHTTANHSIADNISALQDESDIWYGLVICSRVKADILQVAEYIETQKKIFIALTRDADVLTSATDDVASVLKGLDYDRTAILYSGTSGEFGDAAWLGGQLPQIPGASTWKFKQLVGITPDVLTATQRTRLIGNTIAGVVGKRCNIFETVGGENITEEGFMVGGQFIDVTIGIDWVETVMQQAVYAGLVSAPKIPYTDQGIAVIECSMLETLQQGVRNGLIDGTSDISVSFPSVAEQVSADRANRILNSGKFSCRFAGAFHFVVIQGTVTV